MLMIIRINHEELDDFGIPIVSLNHATDEGEIGVDWISPEFPESGYFESDCWMTYNEEPLFNVNWKLYSKGPRGSNA